MTEDQLLNEALDANPPQTLPGANASNCQDRLASSPQESSQVNFKQWQIGANDSFRPCGATRAKLKPGVYEFDSDPHGLFIREINVVTDDLIALPDTANERVLKGMQTFWKMGDLYKKHGLLYKRGMLLWGAPGGGKTATLSLLSQHLLSLGGLVILCRIPELTAYGLSILRRIEPTRALICVMEDIDELIVRFGEHQILALLDGENQVENIVNIATTNYPERLGVRIVNRPSRFDERIHVGMPSFAARKVYLTKVAPQMAEQMLEQWCHDTDGLSIAHLRELAASVLCLGQPYNQVISRLRTMRQKIEAREVSTVGFGLAASSAPSEPIRAC